MSGIAGIFNLDGRPVEQSDLQKMVDSMPHRGPDGRHVWCDGPVGFGHCMLHTTPESLNEILPYATEDGQLAITADARIDNREELFALLGLNGSSRSMPDSTLILKAYQRWGEACLDHLLGDFAFAIWDGRERKVFCARDHLGIRPFYYHFASGRLLVFGTEIKTLFGHPNVVRRLNENGMAQLLNGDLDNNEVTSYDRIFRLPPGTWAVINSDGVRLKTYWQLDPSKEIRMESDEEYAEAFREIFVESVRCRLRSAFPVGAHLSGGLDSSSIACVAKSLLNEGEKLPTFSNVFDAVPSCDERPYINDVLAQGGYTPHFVSPDGVGPLSDISVLLEHEDEVFMSGNHFLVRGLSESARRAGIRVVLDGLDGDTTVGHGTGLLEELALNGDWGRLSTELQALIDRKPAYITAGFDGLVSRYVALGLEAEARSGNVVGFFRKARRISDEFGFPVLGLIGKHGVKPALRRVRKRLAPRRLTRRTTKSTNADRNKTFLSPRFARRAVIQRSGLPCRASHVGIERFRHWQNLTGWIVPYAFETYDRLVAVSEVDGRHPFMDKRLVEFCLALPAEQKLRFGRDRWILRNTLKGSLPESIRMRDDKANMQPNFSRALCQVNREAVSGILNRDTSDIDELVDTSYLRSIFSRVGSEVEGMDEGLKVMHLWRGLYAASWLRRFKAELVSGSINVPRSKGAQVLIH